MRMEKLTTKFQQALSDAQSMAVGRSHQFIEPADVMLALLDQDGAVLGIYLLRAMSMSIDYAQPSARLWIKFPKSKAITVMFIFPKT
jgi:ATP-dependent Clp protease ATP-binding subunit ClpA